jgi:hypothetical protein
MTNEDKQNLANAYANAWRAVKGGDITVTYANGWFTKTIQRGRVAVLKCRTDEIISGLLTLTSRFSEKV